MDMLDCINVGKRRWRLVGVGQLNLRLFRNKYITSTTKKKIQEIVVYKNVSLNLEVNTRSR